MGAVTSNSGQTPSATFTSPAYMSITEEWLQARAKRSMNILVMLSKGFSWLICQTNNSAWTLSRHLSINHLLKILHDV